jgi:pimeloyl-ACP methyl ester carboxylesterase
LAQAVADPSLSAFAAVGLAVEFCDPDLLSQVKESGQALAGHMQGALTCPKLFVTGERDRLAPPGELLDLVEHLPTPKRVQIVPGADHFWWGSEKAVGDLVAEFISKP